MSVNDLSARLWRERELLEDVLFKLETQQLLLSSGRTRWLPAATRELEESTQRVRTEELGRAVASSGAARAWGLDDEATLPELIAAAPSEAWREVLQTHLQALTVLTGEIAELRDANATLLRGASTAVHETLAGLDAANPTYNSDGSADRESGHARFIDTAI